MKPPKVTLVVGPRERFSYTQTSLESIYANTDYPFDLVFVDVCSPASVQTYLQEKSQKTVVHPFNHRPLYFPQPSSKCGVAVCT